MANVNTKIFKSLNESEYKELYTPKRTLIEATTDANEIAEEYKEAYHIDLDWNKVPCVIARDKFLSGWGGAEGKTHYQVVLCGDSTEAANIEANMRSLGKEEGLANIRRDFGVHLSSRVSKAYVVGRYASAWNNLSKSWYESRFDSGKTEDELNQEKDEQEARRQEKLRQKEQQANESEKVEESSPNDFNLKFTGEATIVQGNIEAAKETLEKLITGINSSNIKEISVNVEGQDNLKEEYSEKLGGDPEDFISDVQKIKSCIMEVGKHTIATHLAEEIIEQFLEICDSQISMAKSRFLGESDDIEEFKKKYSKSFNNWKKENPQASDKEIVDILKAKQYNGELTEDEDNVHKMKECTDDVEVIMALEGDTLELDDMEDWNRLKEIARGLASSQGFYGRLLASMEETEEEDLEFPIYL